MRRPNRKIDRVMHDGQVEVRPGVLAAAIAVDFPEHRGLSVRRIDSAGTVITPFRVGQGLLARVPLVPDASASARDRLRREQKHARYLAGRLPVEVPRPIGVGEPFDGYPGVWSLWSWLDGESLDRVPVSNERQLASDLADLVRTHHTLATGGQSWNGEGRGGRPLSDTGWVRESIQRSAHLVDAGACTAIWEQALEADPHRGAAVMIHGDLMPGNLLAVENRLTGMVDISAPVFGDPAADLQPAWVLFDEPTRSFFLAEVGLDDSARERGRGWAFEMAIGGLRYYEHTNPVFFGQAARTLQRLLQK